jgi:hypothetical protein
VRGTQPVIDGFEGGKGAPIKQCEKLLEGREKKKNKKRILPKASRKEHSPADTLIFTQRDACQISDLQNQKITHLFILSH